MVTQLRPSDLAAWLKSLPADAKPVVLDVREPWELQTASVTPDGFTPLCTAGLLARGSMRASAFPTLRPVAFRKHAHRIQSRGRLRFEVPIGPPIPHSRFSPGALR